MQPEEPQVHLHEIHTSCLWLIDVSTSFNEMREHIPMQTLSAWVHESLLSTASAQAELYQKTQNDVHYKAYKELRAMLEKIGTRWRAASMAYLVVQAKRKLLIHHADSYLIQLEQYRQSLKIPE